LRNIHIIYNEREYENASILYEYLGYRDKCSSWTRDGCCSSIDNVCSELITIHYFTKQGNEYDVTFGIKVGVMMKKMNRILVILLVMSAMWLINTIPVQAETAYKTFTEDGYGQYVETQTAYTVNETIIQFDDE